MFSVRLILWFHSRLFGNFSKFFLLNRWVKGWIYSGRLGFFPISCCSLFWLSVSYIFLFLNDISWCYILQFFGHLVNYIISIFQFTSKLYSTNQLYFRNMSILFKFMTTRSIYSLYLLILTSTGVYHVTSPFLVLSILKTLNDLAIGPVLILSSFTSYFSVPVWIRPKSISTYNCNSFPFNILMLVCMFSFLSLLFLQFRIIYQL